MPRYGASKPEVDRSNELRTYCETQLNSDAKKLDFFTQMAVLRQSSQETRLTDEEKETLIDLTNGGFLSPMQEGTEENPQMDMGLYTTRTKDLLKYQYELALQVARDYQQELKNIPENEPNRESKAAYLARQKEAAVRYMANEKYLVQHVHDASQKTFDLAERTTRREFEATLTAEEKELLRIGSDIASEEPQLLDKVSPEEVGLTDQMLGEMRAETEKNLIAKADLNWTDDKTMKDVPSFYNPQVTADSEKRSSRYYLAADEEGKKQYIVNGLLQGELDSKNSVYSEQEVADFKSCLAHYFNPVTPDGKLDFATFEKRMDGIADIMADGYNTCGKEIRTADYSEFMGDYANDLGLKRYAAMSTCKDYLKATTLKSAMEDLQDSKIIDNRLVDNYVEKKNFEPDGEKPTLVDTLENQATKLVQELPGGEANLDVLMNYVPVDMYGRSKIEENVTIRAAESENELLSGIRGDKDWLRPEDNITKESLRKLSNLYEQLKGEDHWYHYNSDEYEKLRDALKVAHDKYQQVKDSPDELSDVEKHKLIGTYDRISNRAMKYLDSDNRASKTRGTDLGQNRYEQAFAALKVTSEGSAKKRLEIHNRYRIKTGAKEISLAELEARANRTRTEQKAHEKRVRKNPAAAKKNDGPEMI